MTDFTRFFVALIALAGSSGAGRADTITVCPDGTCDFASVDGTSIGAVDVSRGRLLTRNSWFRGNQTAANSGAIRAWAGGELSIAGSTSCDNEPEHVSIDGKWTDLGGNAFDAEGCARMAGDLDGDGCVGGADFGLLLQQWSVTSGSPADLNRDGVVDGGDIGVLFTNWGQCF